MAEAPITTQARVESVQSLKSRTPIEGVTVGERVYVHGLSPQRRQSFLSSWVAITTMTIMSGAFHMYLALFAFMWIPWVRLLIFLFGMSLMMPATRWDGFRYSWIFQTWREYLNLSFITEHILDPKDDRGYICCCVQHGVVPYATMAAAAMDERLFPDRNKYCVVSSYLFKLPVIRHIVGWLGGISASRKNIVDLLAPGRSLVFLYQGGLAEMCLGHSPKERVFLKNRKGFVELAVQGGHCLFPMYFFGQSEFLSLWSPGFLSNLSRRIRAPVGFLYGRFGLPIPRQRNVLVVAGKPIDVGPPIPRNDPNFEKRVAEIHEEFISRVLHLFQEYRNEYGWCDKELEIL